MKYLCSRGKWPASAAPREGRLARANDLGLCQSCPGKPISITSVTQGGRERGKREVGETRGPCVDSTPWVARLALAGPQDPGKVSAPCGAVVRATGLVWPFKKEKHGVFTLSIARSRRFGSTELWRYVVLWCDASH